MENNTEEQENAPKSSKVTVIIDKLKKSPMTVVAVLLAAVVVLSAVAVASVIGAKRNGQTNSGNSTVVDEPDTAVRFVKLHSDVKALLFDAGIGRDAIVEQTGQDTENNTVYTIKITVNTGQAESLRQSVVALMDAGRFVPLYSTEPYHLVVAAAGDRREALSGHRYELFIEEEAVAVVTPPPSDNSTAPVVTPPVLVLPPKGNGKIALLIDDAGMNLNLAERLLKQQVPLAVAILPHMPYSKATADLVHAHEQTVFLHFPMEPLSYPATDPGPGAVLVNMPELLIEQIVKQNVENLGSIDGFNNHTGSALTEDAVKIAQVLENIRPYTTNFVDSNTSPKTVALTTCQEIGGFKCGLNRKFLDNENDHDYIRQKLYDMATLANKQGGIITIGHLRPDTVTVLEEVIPQLQALGYQFVPITSLME